MRENRLSDRHNYTFNVYQDKNKLKQYDKNK